MEATGVWYTARSQGTEWNRKIDIFSMRFPLMEICFASVLRERMTRHPPGLNTLQGNWESRDAVPLLSMLLPTANLSNNFFRFHNKF